GWQAPIGGTSFVAPQLAALAADWISLAGGEDMGAADPDIYADANSANYSTDFHDVTSGSNGAFGAGPGWDHPTGWGSLNASEFLTHIDGGIALSPPQNLSDEYFGCVQNTDEYKVSWDAPVIGTPTGYNFQWDEPEQGIGWVSGPADGIIKGIRPNTLVNVRVQATNASVSSQYATTYFTSQSCIAPEVTGTGA
ncbi:MAG: hypothetical protein ACRETQ_01920, partial [Gammaproteobacteria bacterium]